MTSNLHGKNILVFAATGAIAGRAATKFAAAGAHVWVSGHDGERLQSLVEEIRSADGVVNCDEVDATDANAVADYVTRVAAQTGHIDGVFNGIGGRPAGLKYPAVSVTQPIDDFMVPLQRIVGSQFLSAREAAKHMTTQPNGGSIVLLSATLSGMTAPFMAGISATQGAIEAMGRSLAGEFGPGGVRVNTVRGSA
ncbi:MAG: SDR family oxidoreductase, partial [Chloroflexota bacterium]